MTNETLLCWRCVEDVILRRRIQKEGAVGNCTYCCGKRRALPLSAVADVIDTVLRRFYRPSEETSHVTADSDNLSYWAEGSAAADIISELAGMERRLAEDIDELLQRAEYGVVKDGDDAFYGETLLEHVEPYAGEFVEAWELFVERLKHEVRFFDQSCKRMLDELIGDVSKVGGGQAIVDIEPGGADAIFYRARIVNDLRVVRNVVENPAVELGTPPPHMAGAGRMNPPGIPVFYGAFSEATAVAEVRPPVGSRVAVGRFAPIRALRLLDLSFLPYAYHRESIFSAEYGYMFDKVAFFEDLHDELSRPVLRSDEELGYLPTQAVAAYVQNVLGLDGMIYASTQSGGEVDEWDEVKRSSCNLVLLRGASVVVKGAGDDEGVASREGGDSECDAGAAPESADGTLSGLGAPKFMVVRSVKVATENVGISVQRDEEDKWYIEEEFY